MNSQNKIYEFEVTPPAGAWKNIAKELDELAIDKKIAQKINDLEVQPPINVWQNITSNLDEVNQENLISEKVYHIETIPPAFVWDQLSNELDDQKALDIIEKKLADIQITPPASVWMGIKDNLEEKKKPAALVVPMHHGWLKYAAAACFIAILSVTAYFIFGDNNSANNYAVNGTKNNNTSVAATSKPANNTATSSQNQAFASIRTKLGNAYVVSNEKNRELQNRYIILMTPEGNIVRMSKKVKNMADCIAGEDNSCDTQISEWQKEMASSATTAASDNFLGILDMAENETQN